MQHHQSAFPEIGWFKERFQVLEISREYFVFECLMSSNGLVPTHLHEDCDEEFTALEGTLTVKVANTVYNLEPKNKIVASKGEIHSLRNPSKE